MSSEVINLQRTFEIWLYQVSHSQLLLRSNRSSEFATRVDVLFKGVTAICLPTVFEGFTVAEISTEKAQGLNIQVGVLSISSRKVFKVSGSTFVGYVVAGAVFWHEDEGQHFDKSYFQASFPPFRE